MSSTENDHPAASLFTLSMAAEAAKPIPVPQDAARVSPPFGTGSFNSPSSLSTSAHTTQKVHTALKHRRMSSAGLSKRRMSDAREATSRPSPAYLQNASSALSALATLSLAGSPPPQAPPQTSTSFASAVGQIHFDGSNDSSDFPVKEEEEEQVNSAVQSGELIGGGIAIRNGKKRGTIYRCESCSKEYRHPSCLIKHRWEHNPHWREASKLMLSKHQQVQLLEAAAILSHLSPSNTGGRSLPEDRSLWPSYLSGGLLPPPSTSNDTSITATPPEQASAEIRFRASSSVPAQSALSMSRPSSTGPRLHDYSIPTSSGITHVRPGVVGVPIGSSPSPAPTTHASPTPVPVTHDTYRDNRALSVSSDTWASSPVSSAFGGHSYGTTGSWSLPHSSMRSRSNSAPKTEEDDAYIEVDIEGEDAYHGQRYGFASRGRMSAARATKDEDEPPAGLRGEKIDEEWDGEMEMEM